MAPAVSSNNKVSITKFTGETYVVAAAGGNLAACANAVIKVPARALMSGAKRPHLRLVRE
jgi:hypothetical protein